MSKRRRDRTPNLPPEAFNTPLASPATVATMKADGTVAVAQTRKSVVQAVVDWKTEYGEVLRDLGRTFLIFAGLIVAMIALSFVIR